MVKFGANDPEYDNTLERLKGLAQRALTTRTRNQNSSARYILRQTPEARACERDLLQTDPREDINALKRKNGDRARDTCEWILGKQELTAWLDPGRTEVLWLHGNPGTGKSTMATFLVEEISRSFSITDGRTLAYFFCDSSFDTRKTATSIIRGLLYQVVQKHPQLLEDYILPKYHQRGAELFKSFDGLWAIFIAVAADEDTGKKYCIIDALDECDRESQKILLKQLRDTFQGHGSLPNVQILVTSRPYPEIREYLEQYVHKDLASFPEARHDVDRCIESKVAGLAESKHFTKKTQRLVSEILREKAEGTFLWVGLACKELEDKPSHEAVRFLQGMPRGLHSLYTRLLDTACEQSGGADTTQRILNFVVVGQQPLTVLELAEACQLHEEEGDRETRQQFTLEIVISCRLMIVIQDDKVQLLHKSVKDYLVGDGSDHFVDELVAHADVAYRCIELLIDQFHSRIPSDVEFLAYASRNWPSHAHEADVKFQIKDSQAEFFTIHSPCREQWLSERRCDAGPLKSLDDYIRPIARDFTVLHVAARWGIPTLVHYVQGEVGRHYNSTILDCLDTSGLSPLGHAVRAEYPTVASLLLNQGAHVTGSVIRAAAGNEESGERVMTLLLDQRGDQVKITEDVVKAAAENGGNGKEVMALLLDQRGNQVDITENVVKAAAGNEESGERVMTLLLDQRERQVDITEDVVKAAAGNVGNGEEVMALLLDQRGDQVDITEDVVEVAAGNKESGKRVMTLLLSQRGDQVDITDDIVKAAAGNSRNGKEVMTLLLDQRGDQVKITEDVVKAAAGNKESGKRVMALLLDQRGDQVDITENVVKATAGNRGNGKEVMALLLDQRGDQVDITEDVVEVAAGNPYNGKEIMTLLLSQRGDQVDITEDIVKAAAQNSRNGKEVMALLLDQRGDQVDITEDVVKAAAGNRRNGKEVMALLLDQRGDQVDITEDVVEVAAGNPYNGKEIMTLLLSQRGDQVDITENVVKATAGNPYNGKEIMALLLDQRGEQVKITEDVVKAAAGNEESGERVMALLFDRRAESTKALITEEVVIAAATCGLDRVLDLLSQYHHPLSMLDGWRRTSRFYNAAKVGDLGTIEQLLREGTKPDSKNARGETPLLAAARGGHETVVKILARSPHVNINSRSLSGVSPLFPPSRRGHEQIVLILLDAGADPRFKDKNGHTAITWARDGGHEKVAKILEQSGETQ